MGSIKSAPQQPAPPNPQQVASAQTGSNIGTAVANSYLGNANVVGPYGSTTFTRDGDVNVGDGSGNTFNVPRWTQTNTLSPNQQTLLNQQEQLGQGLNNLAINQTDRLSNVLGQPFSSGNLPSGGQIPGQGPNFALANMTFANNTFGDAGDIQRSLGPNDFEASRRSVEDAIYSRLNPQLDRDRASLENTLINQGLVRGSEPFMREMDQFGRQANDARMQAVLAGGQEQTRLGNLANQYGQFANQAQQQAYGQAQGRGQFARDSVSQNNQTLLSGAGFNNSVLQQGYQNQMDVARMQETQRERALQEQLALRNQPINEISALMSGGQVAPPQFTQYQGGQVANTPVGNYIYNTAALQQQQYQQQQQRQNAMMGGLFGLGGALAGGLYGLG